MTTTSPRPRRALLGAAAAVAALAAAPAAHANVQLQGGATTLKLASGTAKVLTDNGVAVAPTGTAKAAGGGVAFPITGGSVHPTLARGRIDHSGGLRFSAGGKSLTVSAFTIRLGKHPVLSAKAGSARVPLLRLSLSRAKLSRSGLDLVVRGVRGSLTATAAKALNATFGVHLFTRGLPIGTATVRATPATVALRGGTTTLALDAQAGAALTSLGITAAPIAPAKAGPAGLSFPITGGSLDPVTLAGTIRHSGGISLTKGATVVRLTAFTIGIDSTPDLTARLGDARASILALDLAGIATKVRGRTVRVSGVGASLTKGAADALNGAFGTTAFAEGLKLGTATVAAKVR